MRVHKVTFQFDAGTTKVTADDVVRAMRLVLGATADLTDWQIESLKLASPFHIVATCPEVVFNPISNFVGVMKKIETGKIKNPRLSVTDARLLDSIERLPQTGFGSVQIAATPRHSVTLNQAAIQRARQVTGQLAPSLMVHAREQLGQVRGDLEQIIAKKGEPDRFGIRDRVSRALIPCTIPDGDVTLFVTASNALRKRVVVSGLIRYGDQSRPTSIKVAHIDVPEDFTIPFDKLPRAPLTPDGDSVKLIRRLRDG